MRIIIFGANGLLGRNLVEHFSKSHYVYATVQDKKNIKFSLNENISIIEVNLTCLNLEILPVDIDAVLYLAQSKKYRDFPSGSEDMVQLNIFTPIQIANWALKNKVKKFLYASSGGIYTEKHIPYDETSQIDVYQKKSFYLNTKLSGEILLRNYTDFFESFLIIRPFFIYGSNQDENMLIPRLIKNIYDGKEIILYGEDGIKINPIYVLDAVAAISNMMNFDGILTINVAGEEIVSIKELCLLIGKLIGKEPVFKVVNEKQKDIVGDITLLKKLIYQPQINMETGIKNVLLKSFEKTNLYNKSF